MPPNTAWINLKITTLYQFPKILYPEDLDRAGWKGFNHFVKDNPYKVFRGKVWAEWKTREHRYMCFMEQEKNNRKERIDEYASKIKCGDMPAFSSTFIFDSFNGKFYAIDGSRRLIACLEAGYNLSDGVVIYVIK